MNTIFKFYYQAWILFSITGAFAIQEMIVRLRSIVAKGISVVLVILILGTGFVYPIYALIDKTNSFQNLDWSMDGNNYFRSSNSLEFEAINFLENMPYGVITEAVGGSYSSFGRISKLTGLPTVLGWPGHESQWRGGVNEIGNRELDIKELYSNDDWEKTKLILDKYDIKYIFIGTLERSTYLLSENKFNDNLVKIFSNPEVSIFEYSPKIQ